MHKLLLLLPLFLFGCASIKPESTLKEISADTLLQLQNTMLKAITVTKPHFTNRSGSLELGANTSFTGNFDYHSSMHAHWALLSLGRIRGDQGVQKYVLDRLPANVLEQERVYLRENPAFENPYGRVWLLQLLQEMERHSEVTSQLSWRETVRGLRQDTELQVLDWLEHTPFPDAGNLPRYYTDKQKFRGEHYSWFFAYLFLELNGPKNPKVQAKLQHLYALKILPHRSELKVAPSVEFDFLEMASLLAFHDLLAGAESTDYLCNRAPFPSKITQENVHRAGAYIMDSWPCALAGSRGQEKAKKIFLEHLQNLLVHPETWRDNFDGISHWVPQYMWMGIWLQMGRP